MPLQLLMVHPQMSVDLKTFIWYNLLPRSWPVFTACASGITAMRPPVKLANWLHCWKKFDQASLVVSWQLWHFHLNGQKAIFSPNLGNQPLSYREIQPCSETREVFISLRENPCCTSRNPMLLLVPTLRGDTELSPSVDHLQSPDPSLV